MNKFEKIINIDSEWQAPIIHGELESRNIPHLIRDYHDSALDGLYQSPGQWGHVEAPLEFKDEIITIVRALHTQPVIEEIEDSKQQAEENGNEPGKRHTITLLLIFCLTILGAVLLFDWHIQSHYIKTMGNVVSVKIQAIGQRPNLADPEIIYGSHIVFVYKVNGKEICGEGNVSNKDIRRGDKIIVRYSKTKPEQYLITNRINE